MLAKDDLRAIVDAMEPLINARAKTTEKLLTGHVSSVVKTIVNKAKEELKEEILASRAAAKEDRLILESKIIRKIQSHERRIDNLERTTGTPNPDKH